MGCGILGTQYSTPSVWSRVQLGPCKAGLRPVGSMLQVGTLRARDSRAWFRVLQGFCSSVVGPHEPRPEGLDTGNAVPAMPEEILLSPPPQKSPGLGGISQARGAKRQKMGLPQGLKTLVQPRCKRSTTPSLLRGQQDLARSPGTALPKGGGP